MSAFRSFLRRVRCGTFHQRAWTNQVFMCTWCGICGECW